MADIIMQGTARGLESRERGISTFGSGIARGMEQYNKRKDEEEEKVARINLVNAQTEKLSVENSALKKNLADDLRYKSIINKGMDIPGTVQALKDANLGTKVNGYVTETNNTIQEEIATTSANINVARDRFNHIGELAASGLDPKATPEQQDQAWASLVVADKQIDPNNNLEEGLEGKSSTEKLTQVSKMSTQGREILKAGVKARNKKVGDTITNLELEIQKTPEGPDRDIMANSLTRLKGSKRLQEQGLKNDVDMDKMKISGTAFKQGKVRGYAAFGLDQDAEVTGDIVDMTSDTERLYSETNMSNEQIKEVLN